jgi:hypothetical protein
MILLQLGNLLLNKVKIERTADVGWDPVRYGTSSFYVCLEDGNTIRCHNKEDYTLNHQRRENQKSHTQNMASFNAVKCGAEYGIT